MAILLPHLINNVGFLRNPTQSCFSPMCKQIHLSEFDHEMMLLTWAYNHI